MTPTDPVTPPAPANQPLRFKRDPETGLVKGLTYRYTSEGLIDWRAHVPVKYLYVAREHEAKVVAQFGKPIHEVDLLQVKDDWLRIRVGGLNHILHLRGARSVTYPIVQTREGFCAVTCEIELIPNEESDMMPEVWSGIASACRASMDTKMLPYLETFAENRAFSRAIKRALQINILSDIEVGGDARKAAEGGGAATEIMTEESQEQGAAPEAPRGFEPYHQLAEICRSHRDAKGAAAPITFETLKAAAIKLNAETPVEKANERVQADPSTWKGYSDIAPIDAWLLIGKIQEAAKAAVTPTTAAKRGAKRA